MWRLFFRGWYALLTLLALALGALMIGLGFWQLDRLDQRRAAVSALEARLALPPLAIAGPGELPAVPPAELEFRSATVTGSYDHGVEVGLQGRSYAGQPGLNLVTPLVLGDGETAVLVDRGWTPLLSDDRADWAEYATSGEQTVTGTIALSSTRGPAGGSPVVFWIDTTALEARTGYTLAPWVLVEAPGEDDLSAPPFHTLPEPDLSDGPHLSYAIQWFSFTVILLVGYVLFIRHQYGRGR